MLLRRLQRGEILTLPHARPMSVVGVRCAELRIQDESVSWRIVYRLDSDAVIIAAVFAKKTQATPLAIIASCRKRFALYDRSIRGED